MRLRPSLAAGFVVITLLAGLGGVAQAGRSSTTRAQSPARRGTTGPALFYTITVTITDTRMKLSRQDLPRTYSARFNIRNLGRKTHSFTLGATLGGKGTVVSRVVKPGSNAVAFFIQNDTRGVLRYYSSVPADRKNRAMQGVFTIS
jgi:hypothetical protein